MKFLTMLLSVIFVPSMIRAEPIPIEIHNQLAPLAQTDSRVALTLDACSGKYDDELIQFLIRNRIPATIFATKRWLIRNPYGVSVIKANLDLFDVEDHGEKHIPAVIGADREVYGIAGVPDLVHLRREVIEGARAVESVTGVAPHWYRGATGIYDPLAVEEIARLGFKIAGFSINADSGATLSTAGIQKRLSRVKGGDVIIAHMNKPESDSAEGLAAGLAQLMGKGLVFVRLDQVELREIRKK